MTNTDLSVQAIREKMIDKVIRLSGKTFYSQAEKESYIESLRSKVNEKLLSMTVREQSGVTNAEDYNRTAYEMYLDITTVFVYLDTLSDAINKHLQLNQSVLNSMHGMMDELEDKINELLSVIGIPGNPLCYYESFRTENNREVNTKLYQERYGEMIPEECIARLVPNHRGLSLSYAKKQNVMVYNNGIQLGNISITKQYGAGFIQAKNPENRLENAIDTSLSSYWSETILSDQELKIKGLGFDSPDGKKYNRSYYDLPRGALCEICLTFESLTKINELDLSPFGNFPIDIIAIRYSLSDDEDAAVYDILSPDNQVNEWLKSMVIKDQTIIHFPEITCKRLFILINQLHCIKNSYLASTNQMFKNMLWFNATGDQTESVQMQGTTVFKPLYIDKAEEDPVWRYINKKMTETHQDLNELILSKNDKLVPVTKYQYTYGFYNIAPNFVDFQNTTVYVSKDIEMSLPIRSIKLYTEEEHYPSVDGFIVSDIEFYITSKKNPSYDDWKPLCPYNKNYVYRELLQLDYAYCYLRHKALCQTKVTTDINGNQKVESIRPIVYMNDIILTEEADYILRFDNNMNVEAIEISNIDHFALYSVEYQPIEESKELSLIADDLPVANHSFEEIIGNGAACYKLSEFPYYENESSASHLKLININNGGMLIQSDLETSPIECVTNKNNPSESFKNFTKTGKLQYYTSNDYLFFNRPILKEEKIEINYPSFSSSVKIKAILRRNTKRDSWITPILKSYRLEVTSI